MKKVITVLLAVVLTMTLIGAFVTPSINSVSAATTHNFNYEITLTGTEDVEVFPDVEFFYSGILRWKESWFIPGPIPIWGTYYFPFEYFSGTAMVNAEEDTIIHTLSPPDSQNEPFSLGVVLDWYSVETPGYVTTYLSTFGGNILASTDYSDTETRDWSYVHGGSYYVSTDESDVIIPTPRYNAPNLDTTWSVTDDNDCVSTWMDDAQRLHASGIDTIPPALTVPADVTVEQETAEGTVVPLTATAADPCGSISDITDDAPSIFPPGTTTVTFIATDDSGNSAQGTTEVTVVDTTPPTADPIPDQTVHLGEEVLFTGSGSDPGGNPITAYYWYFGEGDLTDPAGWSSLQNPTHTYTAVGSYLVKFKVKCSLGTWSSFQIATITVSNNAPTAGPIPDRTVHLGEEVVFSGSGSDPDGDPITYEWMFGDGASSTLQNPTHIYTLPGSYTVTFRVEDCFGATSSYQTATVTAVIFPDANLEALIREEIGKPTGVIYPVDLLPLTTLNGYERAIADITGLEYCINLTRLYLGNNRISDISPLQNLTSLTRLYLGNNRISDISPLENLTRLTHLSLYINHISDISPLQNLTSLTSLALYINYISDISPLQNLTSLTSLALYTNHISDISPLQNLTSLTHLLLFDNQISDIQLLVDNTSLATDDYVDLRYNPLSSVSLVSLIPALERKGVVVRYSSPVDSDGDGIRDDVDIRWDTPSDKFSDGTTFGSIINRGDQVLTIIDAVNPADGVQITADPSGGPSPARINVSDGAELLSLNAGDDVIVTEGSVSLEVIVGPVEVTLVGDDGTMATLSVPADYGFIFYPEALEVTAFLDNPGPIYVFVVGDPSGEPISVEPDTTTTLPYIIDIDIKPGSDPNSINLGSGGTVPVAIFSALDFDATTVNPTTVELASAPVKLKGKGTPMAASEDVNGDGLLDLVVHVSTEAFVISDADQEAVLEGQTYDGVRIVGADTIRVVP